MTLRATADELDVRGLRGGPKYKVEAHCANPNCRRWTDHAHHILRRSFLAGDYAWVEIKGTTIGNLAGLCFGCHEDVTGTNGHKAAIFWIDEQWWWCLVTAKQAFPSGESDGFTWTQPAWFVESNAPERIELKAVDLLPIAPLDPHPPTLEQATERAHAPHPVSGSDTCPTCGRPTTRKTREPGRKRASWIVRVPADEQEDGAAVLDVLVDDLALVLGYDGDNARYYTIVPAMAFAQLNRQQFQDEIAGLAR